MNLDTRSRTKSLLLGLGLGLVASAPVSAAVVMEGTRVVFPGDRREVSVRVENQSDTPSLVQAWLDDGDPHATPASANAPFVVRPPIFRIDAGRRQVLRLQQAGEAPPQDRESLYWFNLRDVPATGSSEQSSDDASLHLIVRTRVKVFYRPKGLKADGAAKAPHQLQWSVSSNNGGGALTAFNPTPYHINLNRIDAKQGALAIGDGIVKPFSSAQFPLTHSQMADIKQHVSFEYVNDHGGRVTLKTPIDPR